MWWKKLGPKTQEPFNEIVNYSCLKCHHQIKVPRDYIDQFKLGGREYHIDGQSYLNCPNCGEMIEIKVIILVVKSLPRFLGQIFLDLSS